MDTNTQLQKLIELTDEANQQREALLRRIEIIEANIANINKELSYLTTQLTTQSQNGEN